MLLAGVDGAGWMAAAASLQVPVAAYRFGVELTLADGVAAQRPAPRPTTELGGVLRAVLSARG